MLHVSGLACPWNVYNSYNELIRPGAFAEFIADHPNGVQMGFMHDLPCGHWDKLEETPAGLWVSGRIINEGIANLVQHSSEFRQLSITYGMPKNNRIETEARLNSRPSFVRARHAKDFKIFPRIEVPEAFLAEVSIVDDGAFSGTHLDIG